MTKTSYLKDGVLLERAARSQNLSPKERCDASPKSLRAAVNYKCFQCQGEFEDPGVWKRVRECPIEGCALFQLRRK